MYSAVALGASASGRMLFVADRCWDVGGLGTLVLGIWLALHLDQYGFFDGWIIGAIVLWFVATGLGQSVQRRMASGETAAIGAMHWIRTLVVLGLLAAIRPDDVNIALFVHVLGAMALVGSLVLVVTALAADNLRLGFRPLLLAVIPSWIVMRVAAQWTASKEHVDDLD